MQSILDQPPGYVIDHVAKLAAAMDLHPTQGGIPAKDGNALLLATWNSLSLAGIVQLPHL